MRRIRRLSSVLIVLIYVLSSIASSNDIDSIVTGTAEDLWGNRVNLDMLKHGATIINPLSPSNCGYCLLDGLFTEENYFEPNAAHGGRNFFMSLFNPQLDNYTFLKHYRSEHTPMLTGPTSLTSLQTAGFPYLIAIRDGEIIYSGSENPYDHVWEELKQELWPDDTTLKLKLTSPLKLSDNIVLEREPKLLTVVVPDGNQSLMDRMSGRYAETDGAVVKFESELTALDMTRHVEYSGRSNQFTYSGLIEASGPLVFDSVSFTIGPYTFPTSEYGIMAAYPNPYNVERYIILECSVPGSGWLCRASWNDFVVFAATESGDSYKKVLEGFFAKGDSSDWRYSDSLVAVYGDLKNLCKGKSCPLPYDATDPLKTGQYSIQSVDVSTGELESGITPGRGACRFPSLAAGPNGDLAVTWEEDGDIIMAVIHNSAVMDYTVVERRISDSYNPRIAWDGTSYMIAYLNNQDGIYRVYGRYLDHGVLSDESRISSYGTCDAISPCVVSTTTGDVAVIWTEWQANYRYPKVRTYSQKTSGPIRDVHIHEEGTNGYTNAWFASAVFDDTGELFGAWNQHYPTILGVAAGDLRSEAALVTGEKYGGYPSLVRDSTGEYWVFWESSMWNVTIGYTQQIRYSRSVDGVNWSIPQPISVDSMTQLNQTPRACVARDGRLCVVWSGRDSLSESNWQVYSSSYDGKEWNYPFKVSSVSGPHRAPDVCASMDGSVWAAWHFGRGEDSKIRIKRLMAR